MLHFLRKSGLTAALAFVSLGAASSSLMANQCFEPCTPCDPCADSRTYVGAFGGGIFSNGSKVSQYGTAFFSELSSIGPLPVIAEGRFKKSSTGFGGVQLGCEMTKPMFSDWIVATAGEVEVFFFEHKRKGHLLNKTVIGLPEHDFADSFHMNSTVILANGVISLKNDWFWGLQPYVGGGIGAARLSLHKAKSFQTEPVEAGVNHFNSRRNDSSWAFAAQAKAGVRYNFSDWISLFAEYRYVYVDTTNYIFGATNYKTHVPTSPWNVRSKDVHYNAFALGVQFSL